MWADTYLFCLVLLLLILILILFLFNFHLQGIVINTPVQWPLHKGFSFTCWLRVESFPTSGTMGLFNFLSQSRRGYLAVLAQDRLSFEVERYFYKKFSVFLVYAVLYGYLRHP